MGTAKRDRKRENRQLRLQELQRAQQRKQLRKRGLIIGGSIAALLLVAAVIAIVGGGDDDGDEATTDTTVAGATTVAGVATGGGTLTGPTPCPPVDGSAERTVRFAEPPPTCIDPARTYTATVTTNKGPFTMVLDPAAAPVAVNNFVTLARYHYYDTTPCHRIITDFAVQCGDPEGSGAGDYPGYSIAEEPPADVSAYSEGVVAMAKTAQPSSTGGQFFIVAGPEPGLTADYSIIGRVSEGYDTTVAAMEGAADPAARNGVPTLEPITIESITITET